MDTQALNDAILEPIDQITHFNNDNLSQEQIENKDDNSGLEKQNK